MKALIIGFGSIGKKHALALNSFCEVAILSKSAVESTLSEFGVSKVYRDFSELNLNEFELFIIANITNEHLQTLEFLDSKVKDKIILVEKPLFESKKEFQSKRNLIFVAYLLRFNPVIKALRKRLKKQKSYFASLVCNSYLPHWRSGNYKQNYSAKKELGGGVLLDLSHELDLAFYLFGDLRLNYSQNLKLSELEISSDDFAFLALENEKRAKIHIELDYFSKFNHRQICVHSPKKSFVADLITQELHIYNAKKKKKTLKFKNDTLTTLKAMYKAIFKKSKYLCTLEQGLKVLELCDLVKKDLNG